MCRQEISVFSRNLEGVATIKYYRTGEVILGPREIFTDSKFSAVFKRAFCSKYFFPLFIGNGQAKMSGNKHLSLITISFHP